MKALAGLGSLIRFVLRRDRVFLTVWILAIVGIIYATAQAVVSTYDTPAEIASYAANIGSSPATIAMNGPPVALDEVGGILIYETSLTAFIATALMAIFVVVRHTRSEEEAGRTELLSSTVVAPQAAPAAAVLVAFGAGAMVGLGVAASLASVGVSWSEAVLFGAAVTAMGWAFSAVAAAAAQIMTHARGAIGLGLAGLAAAFGLRAIGDTRGGFLSWLSPMGWSQQVLVFDENRWWPLLLSVAFAGVLLVVTAVLNRRRDLGAGIVQPRPGPADAPVSLAGAVGLSWRLQRAMILAWFAGVLVLGLIFGAVSQEMQNMVEDNPTLAEYFERVAGASLVDAFFSTSILLMSIAAAGFAVSSALRTRTEEMAGRLDQVLATGVSRSRWYLGSLAVTLAGSTLVVASGGLGVGLAYALVTDDVAAVWRLTGYVLVYLPAVLALVALALVLLGWAPRTTAVVWVALAMVFVIGYFSGIISFPSWVENLSPFTHTPTVPAEDLTVAPVLALGTAVVAGVALGLVGFRHRDVGRV